ncbi:MAG: 4-hydroxy-tetrahydrodipicolinate reductase, partial [Dehalococcoidia bacterium]|nr:4-hydroxy-tetrahydrodipicolinate reductase [Dehalococcoidia bacterium]
MAHQKVLVHGALGKMGQEVLRAVSRDPDLTPIAAVDIKAQSNSLLLPDGSRSIPLSAEVGTCIEAHRPDVLVDFTNAAGSLPALRVAIRHGVAVVSGTTGFSEDALDEIRRLCREHQVGAIIAPNFALAAVLMMHLSRTAAPFFDHADIIELHHEQKLDAPSGTAIATAKDMARARGNKFIYPAAGSENVPASRGGQIDGIAIHSVRLPGMLAHQEVIFG